jgi:hypothetical protein
LKNSFVLVCLKLIPAPGYNRHNHFVKDTVKSNRFIYNEDVHAVYATYQKAFESFGYEVGMRAEAVFTKRHLTNLDSFVTNNYFKLYPPVHLSYKLNESSELQLNYRFGIIKKAKEEALQFDNGL